MHRGYLMLSIYFSGAEDAESVQIIIPFSQVLQYHYYPVKVFFCFTYTNKLIRASSSFFLSVGSWPNK